MSKVLVACPTHQTKHYALESYLAAYSNFTHPDKHLYIIDNTEDGGWYYEHLKNYGIEMLEHREFGDYRPALSNVVTRCVAENIIPKAREIGADWVFHLEIDVICPNDTINILLQTADFHGADYVWHTYQGRNNKMLFEAAMGCNMWRTDLYKPGESFRDYAEAYMRGIAASQGAVLVGLTNALVIEHKWSAG